MPGGTELSGDEALAEMARRYFRSHGPASITDFAWWTGVTLTEARRTHIARSVHAVQVTTLVTLALTAVAFGLAYLLPRKARAGH